MGPPATPRCEGRSGVKTSQHIHSEKIDAYVRRHTSEAERRAIEIHLESCPACRFEVAAAAEFSQALAGLQQETAEKRKTHRIPTNEAAVIKILKPESLDQWDVRIRDVSKGGMALRTPKAIDRRVQVMVVRGTLVSYGEVRYCVRVGETFHVGIRVQ
jgi:anti-sigma factor RsiW